MQSKKLTVLFEAPFLTLSGYGTHSRQILEALLKTGQFEIYANPLRWGDCAWISEHANMNVYWQVMQNYQNVQHIENKNFDLYVMVSIPNEFQRKAKFNVLVTAGIEADRLKTEWIDGCNRADLVVVPSNFSAAGVRKTVVTIVDQNKQTKENKFAKLITVVPEGVDTNIYNPTVVSNIPLNINTDFNFLFVGQWGNGGYNEDRKNVANTIRWFCEEFANDSDVGLILKVNGANNSKLDQRMIQAKIRSIKENFKELKCKIYLLYGTLEDQHLAELYNHPKVRALLNIGRECWWLPGIEAAACDLPIISLNWGGQLDYLNKGKFTKVEYIMSKVPEQITKDGFMAPNAEWASAEEHDFKRKLRKFYNSPKVPKDWAKELGVKIRQEFEIENVQKQFLSALGEAMSRVSNNPLEALADYQEFKKELGELEGKNLLFIFPQHAGDVLLTTATIQSLKKKYPTHNIYYATNNHYFSLIENHPDIHKLINFREFMMNVGLLEKVFDLVYAPFLHIQMVGANWVQKGNGRNIKDEIAAQCGVEAGETWVNLKEPKKISTKKYITFAPGSGKEQWSARRYEAWQDVIDNVNKLFPNEEVSLIQIGKGNEPLFKNVADFRGNQLIEDAWLVKNAIMHIGIDTFSAHLANHFKVPSVVLFGSSHVNSTGGLPKDKVKKLAMHWPDNIIEHNFEDHTILLEPIRRGDCEDKACFKWECQYE